MRMLAIPLLGVMIAVGCGLDSSVAQEPSQRSAAAQRGYQIAARQCASCHSIDARGRSRLAHAPPFRSIRLHSDQSTLTQILDEISKGGHNRMPALPLSASERDDLIAYLQSWNP